MRVARAEERVANRVNAALRQARQEASTWCLLDFTDHALLFLSIKNTVFVNKTRSAAELEKLVNQLRKELADWQARYKELALSKGAACPVQCSLMRELVHAL